MSEQNPEEQENTQLLRQESRNERGNRMGFGSIAIKFWEISSHSAFILGASCYMVNGVYWLYAGHRFTAGKMQTTANPAINIGNATNATVYQYYNYYYAQTLDIRNSAKWWEVAGAIFYMLNPLFEFGTGSLKNFCGEDCCHQPSLVHTFVNLPWMPLAAVLFLIGSIFYTINVFVPLLNVDGYNSKVYEIVDLCAAITFVLDAFAYLIARLSRKWKERGTSDETSILCCHSNYRGCLYLDWGFYGDIFFIIGAFVEVVDHFHFTNELNLVACLLWGTDAALYVVEWVLIHKIEIGQRRAAEQAQTVDIEMQANPHGQPAVASTSRSRSNSRATTVAYMEDPDAGGEEDNSTGPNEDPTDSDPSMPATQTDGEAESTEQTPPTL